MRNSEFAFINDVRAAAELRTPRTSRMLLITTLALLAVGLTWAHFAVLDEVKRGPGRVVPSQQIQVIQSLEGGIVDAILVKEGDVVKKGQPLIRINDTSFASQLGEIKQREVAMAARVARLQAESNGLDIVTFPEKLKRAAPDAVAAELSVFAARKRKLAQDIDVLIQQQVQRQQELNEDRATQRKLTQTLKLLEREDELTRKLYKQKVVPEIEMIRLERQVADMRGQLDVVNASIPKAEAGIQEARARMANARAAFRAQADEDLAKSKGDLAVLDENMKAAQDKVSRTELRAPVYGIVNKVNVTTIGEVVQPAANLIDIVPLDDTLLVEGRIRPQDIAFIRKGEAAVVKLSAYNSNVYGTLKGKVERISADTISDEKAQRRGRDETFYRVMVRTTKNHLGSDAHPLPIMPGMIATVEIMTGKKTVLDYLTKPARMLREEALREH